MLKFISDVSNPVRKQGVKRMAKGFFVVLVFALCSATAPGDQNKCTEKYTSQKWKTVIYHSKDWKVYEFKDVNIGLEYRGLQNYERRYDAEIIITFIPLALSEDEFYNLFFQRQVRKEQMSKSAGAALHSKTFDGGFKEFAGKKWRVLGSQDTGTYKGESFTSREVNYMAYSPEIQVIISENVKGKEISGLADEVDCILAKLEFR